MAIHKLRYRLIPETYPTEGEIVLGESVLHHIKDVTEFYSALGYTDEARRLGLAPDEFFWEEYRKEGSKFRPSCFGARILEYLLKSSRTFKADNMELLRRWTGSCLEIALQEKRHCTHCLINPSNTDF